MKTAKFNAGRCQKWPGGPEGCWPPCPGGVAYGFSHTDRFLKGLVTTLIGPAKFVQSVNPVNTVLC